MEMNPVQNKDVEAPSGAPREYDEKAARRARRMRRLKTALAWTAVVLVIAFLILFISYKVGRFESILDMLDFIRRHFQYADMFKPAR